MKRKTGLIFSLGAVLFAFASCGSNGGANSEEKALQNVAKAHINRDVEGMCNASAPKELWDYICDDAGLSLEMLFYKIAGGDEESFNDSADSWKKRLEEEKMEISDLIIEEKNENSDKVYTAFNRAMKSAGIEKSVDKIYYVDSNYSDGYAYEIDGKWYYGPEWFFEDVIEIAEDGYDYWND